jgi:uncharacterized membrane protein YkgB
MVPRKSNVTTFLTLSAAAAFFVGFLVFFAVRKLDLALIGAGITFVVALVAIATLALTVPENDGDPDKPRLS